MRISDWSSDVCSSDLWAGVSGHQAPVDDDHRHPRPHQGARRAPLHHRDRLRSAAEGFGMTASHFPMRQESITTVPGSTRCSARHLENRGISLDYCGRVLIKTSGDCHDGPVVFKSAQGSGEAMFPGMELMRSEEHTSDLQSLMHISHAVFCLKITH